MPPPQQPQQNKWEQQIWSIPLTNQLVADMLSEFLAGTGMGEVKAEVVTGVTVDPQDGLVTFFFTHTRAKPLAPVLQLVPDAEQAASQPRRIPVKGAPGGK